VKPLALRNGAAANVTTAIQILLDPFIAFLLQPNWQARVRRRRLREKNVKQNQ
jgi:hypothetical protein